MAAPSSEIEMVSSGERDPLIPPTIASPPRRRWSESTAAAGSSRGGASTSSGSVDRREGFTGSGSLPAAAAGSSRGGASTSSGSVDRREGFTGSGSLPTAAAGSSRGGASTSSGSVNRREGFTGLGSWSASAPGFSRGGASTSLGSVFPPVTSELFRTERGSAFQVLNFFGEISAADDDHPPPQPPTPPHDNGLEDQRPPFLVRAAFYYVTYILLSSLVCIFFGASFQLGEGGNSPQPSLSEVSLGQRIISSVYFVKVSTFTIGYGDVTPVTPTGKQVLHRFAHFNAIQSSNAAPLKELIVLALRGGPDPEPTENDELNEKIAE
ncbi:hypothetical protein ABKV19_002405 [Rosa sericea]